MASALLYAFTQQSLRSAVIVVLVNAEPCAVEQVGHSVEKIRREVKC
jgi:hypothetical protein